MASDKERREVMDWLNDSDDDDDDVSPQPAEVEAGQDDNKPAGAPDGAPVDGGGARGDEPADAPADGADADASNLDEEGGGDALSDAIADSAPEPCDAAFVDEEVAFPGAKEARESQASLRSMILDDDDDDDDDDGDAAPERSCIIFLDSLGMHNSVKVASNLRVYLELERKKRGKVSGALAEAPVMLDHLPLVTPKAPVQPTPLLVL